MVNVEVPSPADFERLGREITRALRVRSATPPATGARHRWEAEWETMTRVPWREWVRRQQPKRVRVLMAARPWDTRVWIDDHEIHGLLRDVLVEQTTRASGDLTLVIPLELVEIL